MNGNNGERIEEAIERAQRAAEAIFDRTEAELEAFIENLTRQSAALQETRNELLNNITARSLGGPSREAENAELLVRLRQLAANIEAALENPLSGVSEADRRAFDNLADELRQAEIEAGQARSPDA